MNVIFLPGSPGNPYQSLLEKSLKRHGVDVSYRYTFPSFSWLLKNKPGYILHMHWPHVLYAGPKCKIPFNVILLTCKLIFARISGYNLIWTMHNLLPHERNSFIWDYFIRIALVLTCRSIIVHCAFAEEMLKTKLFRKKNIFVIPHGNFNPHYTISISKENARKEMGIDIDAFVYLFFGNIRPYKNLNSLIHQFEKINDERATLIIAGKCSDDVKKEIQRLIQNNRQIKTFTDYIPDNNISTLFSASDVLVAPFTDILTSGSVILAMSLGVPVIAPSIGCLPELVKKDAGILYSPLDKNGLSDTLIAIKKRNTEKMGKHAAEASAKLEWDMIAQKTYSVYRGLNE